MCKVKNKLLILISILILFIATNVNAKKIPLTELSVGNTLNINSLSSNSVEIIGNLLDGDENKFIKNFSYPANNLDVRISEQTCLTLESLQNYDYQHIETGNSKPPYTISFNHIVIKNLGIPNMFLNNHFTFGVVQICRLMKSSTLETNVIDKFDLPDIKAGFKNVVFFNTTAIFRLRQNNETHYVSSIATGGCIHQVYVNNYEVCSTKDDFTFEKTRHFFNSSVYQSFIRSATAEDRIDNSINEYFFRSSLPYFLHSFLTSYSTKKQLAILERLGNNFVISIELHPLPKLPKKSEHFRHWNGNSKNLHDLEPGDALDAKDLKKINSPLKVDHLLVEPNQYLWTLPSINHAFTDCIDYESNKNINFKSINSTSQVIEKVNVFREINKKRYNGVNPKYLNGIHKCIEVTFCSELQKVKFDSIPLKFIDLSEIGNDTKYVFDRENIVFKYGRPKSHIVSGIAKGKCLFQTLILPPESNRTNLMRPIFIGRILSAGREHDLEKWVKKYLAEREKSLFNVEKDILVVVEIFKKLTSFNSTVIKLYLTKI